MTIREYFDSAYMATSTDEEFEAVEREEEALYELEGEEFTAWLDAHGIGHSTTEEIEAIQQWAWDMEE